MYEAFYGLTEKPFNLTPDPRFLCLSGKHKEAFSHLLYGIMSRSGFIMISGEIGTGKTTICRYLLSKLDLDTEVAFVFNPTLSPEELLRTINQDFGIDTQADTVKGLIDELNTYLLDRYAQGKNCVLVIDEAQDLEPRVLEQIRLLSNLETETAKLLQIILIGQPELPEMLELPELRQLNQRITARYHLEPLNSEETMQYIAFRLRIAGARNSVKFTKSALSEIYRFSKGTPRVINAVCDRALLIGFTLELREFDRTIIRRAIHEIRGEWVEKRRKSRSNRRMMYPMVAAVAAVALIVAGPFGVSWLQRQWKAQTVATAPADDSAADILSILNPEPEEPATGDERAAKVLERALSLVQEKSKELEGTAVASTAGESVVHAAVKREGGLLDVEVLDPSDVHPATPVENAVMPEAPAVDDSSPMAQTLATILQVHREQRNAKRMAMDEAYAGMDAGVAFKAGVSQLLNLWEVDAAVPEWNNTSLETLRALAQEHGLACDTLSVSLDKLSAINLPALVEVRTQDQTLWVALLSSSDATLQMSHLDDHAITVAREDFEAHHTGQCALLWRDPSPDAEIIKTTSSGPAVRDLQLQLKALGRYTGEVSTNIDSSLVQVVRALQQETGLHADGIVGRQTRMVLSSWLPSSPTPWLRAGGAYTVGELAMTVKPAATAESAPPAEPAPTEATTAPPVNPPPAPSPEPVAAVVEAPSPDVPSVVESAAPSPVPDEASAKLEPAAEAAPASPEPPATPEPAVDAPVAAD